LEELAGCNECGRDAGMALYCDICRRGFRCVQSLFNPKWAAIEQPSGKFSLYKSSTCLECPEEAWKKVNDVRVTESKDEGPPVLLQFPDDAPDDLERHLTPVDGDCKLTGENPEGAITTFFAGAPSKAVHVVEIIRSTEATDFAIGVVESQGHKGVVALEYESGSCNAWRVAGFGLEGCPADLPKYFPSDLRDQF